MEWIILAFLFGGLLGSTMMFSVFGSLFKRPRTRSLTAQVGKLPLKTTFCKHGISDVDSAGCGNCIIEENELLWNVAAAAKEVKHTGRYQNLLDALAALPKRSSEG